MDRFGWISESAFSYPQYAETIQFNPGYASNLVMFGQLDANIASQLPT